jgi:dihydrofolate reductase
MSTTALIVAMDENGVIAVDGKIPWHYKADFKRFKEQTMGGTLIMGNTTYESLPKPLPGRQMVVLTRKTDPESFSKHPKGSAQYFPNVEVALLAASSDQHGYNYPTAGNFWVIGGGQVYDHFLRNNVEDLDFLDVTLVPKVEVPIGAKVTYFPAGLLKGWNVVKEEVNAEEPLLRHLRYELV